MVYGQRHSYRNILPLSNARLLTAAGVSIISYSLKNGRSSCFAVTDRIIETELYKSFTWAMRKYRGTNNPHFLFSSFGGCSVFTRAFYHCLVFYNSAGDCIYIIYRWNLQEFWQFWNVSGQQAWLGWRPHSCSRTISEGEQGVPCEGDGEQHKGVL